MAPSPVTRGRQNTQNELSGDSKRFMESMKKEIIAAFDQKMDRVNESLEFLRNEMVYIKESLNSAKSEIERLDRELDDIRRNVREGSLGGGMDDVLKEMDDRVSRLPNVIIRGLVEEGLSVEERKQKDEKAVSELLAFLHADPVAMCDLHRVGKSNNKNARLLRVSLSSAAVKHKILRNSRSLKNSSFKNVFVQPDLTKKQREQNAILRKELSTRRNNGEDVVIHGGQVRKKSELADFRHRF